MQNAHDYLSASIYILSYCKMCMVTLVQNVLGYFDSGCHCAASKKVEVNSLIFMFSFDRDIIHAYSGGIVACSLWV